MDFSVIRSKPPPRQPEPPAPKPPAEPKETPPPPHENPLPPHPMVMPPMGPYMEEFDRISRMQRLRNIEYTNARTWRMNFGHHPNDYYDNSYSNFGYHYPGRGYNGGYDNHMFPARHPLPDHHHHSLTGPPQWLALPPPDHNYGPLGPINYPAPYYGGYFNDEKPNGCMIM